jgi:tetratricopeptide (TPR) repeat protein
VDPRILHARELYELYDQNARTGDYYRIFALLDSISDIYMLTPHYLESFELGVLHNNRAAAMLTIALYRDSIPESSNPYFELSTDSIVALAEIQIRMAIALYEGWNSGFEGKEDAEIRQKIEAVFMNGLEQTYPDLADKYLTNRVKEILASLMENQRRLSVCYTNLGLVYRLREEYPEAVAQYEKAMELWERNLDAENNLNKLLGRPLKKRNFIQKMFPPDKEIPSNN